MPALAALSVEMGEGNRERLDWLYGRHQRLELLDTEQGGTTARIVLPFRPAEDSAGALIAG